MSRLNTGTDSSSGASQKPVVATIVYSRAEPSITLRPSHNHANSITATPPHSSTDDSTSPCPKRSQDRCRDSSSGSCSRVLPAPRPPAVIIAAPRNPSSAGLASGDVVNADSRANVVTAPDCSLTSAVTQADRLAANLASLARPAFACSSIGAAPMASERPAW